MTVHLACLCGERDEIPTPSHEPVVCRKCGDRMYAIGSDATEPKPWAIPTTRPEQRNHAR